VRALSRHSLTRPQAFVQHYYAAFDAEATRPGLAALYQPSSMLTFEGSKLQARTSPQGEPSCAHAAAQGGDAIVQKLVGLPFKSCQHKARGEAARWRVRESQCARRSPLSTRSPARAVAS